MNVIWIFDLPIDENKGGTERVTSIIQKELSSIGFKNLGTIVINVIERKTTYNDVIVENLYDFLKEKDINIVINQKAQDANFLKYFLESGG